MKTIRPVDLERQSNRTRGQFCIRSSSPDKTALVVVRDRNAGATSCPIIGSGQKCTSFAGESDEFKLHAWYPVVILET